MSFSALKKKKKKMDIPIMKISEAAFCIFLVGGKKSTRLFFRHSS